jgi:hypothetical protein
MMSVTCCTLRIVVLILRCNRDFEICARDQHRRQSVRRQRNAFVNVYVFMPA